LKQVAATGREEWNCNPQTITNLTQEIQSLSKLRMVGWSGAVCMLPIAGLLAWAFRRRLGNLNHASNEQDETANMLARLGGRQRFPLRKDISLVLLATILLTGLVLTSVGINYELKRAGRLNQLVQINTSDVPPLDKAKAVADLADAVIGLDKLSWSLLSAAAAAFTIACALLPILFISKPWPRQEGMHNLYL